MQCHGEFLALSKILGRVGDFPCVPVLQEDRAEHGVCPEVVELVVVGRAVKGVVETLVGLDACEDLENVVRRVRRDRLVLEKFGQCRVVTCRRKPERFHRDFAGVQFICVSQVDERMAQTGSETVEYGLAVGGTGGATLEEEFFDHGFPVVALQDELVLEEVDKGALVGLSAEKLSVIVQGDLRRRVLPVL